jgi:hypothetical protein
MATLLLPPSASSAMSTAAASAARARAVAAKSHDGGARRNLGLSRPRRLLSAGASPPVCLSFAGWLSRRLLSRPPPCVTFRRAAASRVQTMATARRAVAIIVDFVVRRAIAIIVDILIRSTVAIVVDVVVRRAVAIVVVDVVVRRAVAMVDDVIIRRAIAIIVDFVTPRAVVIIVNIVVVASSWSSSLLSSLPIALSQSLSMRRRRCAVTIVDDVVIRHL